MSCCRSASVAVCSLSLFIRLYIIRCGCCGVRCGYRPPCCLIASSSLRRAVLSIALIERLLMPVTVSISARSMSDKWRIRYSRASVGARRLMAFSSRRRLSLSSIAVGCWYPSTGGPDVSDDIRVFLFLHSLTQMFFAIREASASTPSLMSIRSRIIHSRMSTSCVTSSAMSLSEKKSSPILLSLGRSFLAICSNSSGVILCV